jgi:hypothetical protein
MDIPRLIAAFSRRYLGVELLVREKLTVELAPSYARNPSTWPSSMESAAANPAN